MLGDYMLDPPDDPPIETCRDCDGTGERHEPEVDTFYGPLGDVFQVERNVQCPDCDGTGERHLTDEEVLDDREAAAEAKAEARAEARAGW